MKATEKITRLLQEAEIYRSQGLFADAKSKYTAAIDLINRTGNIKNRENLIVLIQKKLSALQTSVEKITQSEKTSIIPEKVQDLIKTKFSFSQDQAQAVLEGAIALAKFGQFERALAEFRAILPKEALRIVAAKNIVRCHIALDSTEGAVAQYHEWLITDLFAPGQLEKIRIFLQDILRKKGLSLSLPKVKTPSLAAPAHHSDTTTEEDDFFDISAIGINLDKGLEKGKVIDLEVSFQAGNVISLFILERDKELIHNLAPGAVLKDVQFYSPFAVFRGSGVVTALAKIESGPRMGSFGLDLKVVTQ